MKIPHHLFGSDGIPKAIFFAGTKTPRGLLTSYLLIGLGVVPGRRVASIDMGLFLVFPDIAEEYSVGEFEPAGKFPGDVHHEKREEFGILFLEPQERLLR